MALYEILPDRFSAVPSTTLREQRLREREDLQKLLRDQIDVVAPETLLLSEEFGDWEDSRRRIDLLGLDRQANLVVIELKTEDDGGHLELQALRYAAMISKLTFDQAKNAYDAYLRRRGIAGEATSRILEFLGWTQPGEGEFARDVRIILVAPDFSKEITSTVMWLNDRELDIRCMRVRPYKLDERLLVDVEQIIPLPEAEEYQVRIRRKETEERARRVEKTFDDLWKELSTTRSPEEQRLARELYDWEVDAGMKVFPLANGFAQEFKLGKASYYFFKVRTDGEVAIWFQYLGNKKPFSDPSLREELRQRLCRIPGVEISPERLAGKPRFALSLLSPASAMQQFQDAWLWAMDVIRAAGASDSPGEVPRANGASP
jgi:hypothetical protein